MPMRWSAARCVRPALCLRHAARAMRQIGIGVLALALLLGWWVPQQDWIALRATPVWRGALVLGTVAAGASLYGIVLLACGVRPAQFVKRPARRDDEPAPGRSAKQGPTG